MTSCDENFANGCVNSAPFEMAPYLKSKMTNVGRVIGMVNSSEPTKLVEIKRDRVKRETRAKFVDELAELWRIWIETFVEIEGQERFIISYTDPRQAAKWNERLRERYSAGKLKEKFEENLKKYNKTPDGVELCDAFVEMINSPMLVFLVGTKIARMAIEDVRDCNK